MASTTQPSSSAALWIGRALSALPILALVSSAAMKLSHQPVIVSSLGKFGYSPDVLTGLGIVELLSAALYAIPQTRFFGAVLVTAYLGGATATHVRIGDPFFIPVVLGVLVWLGLYVRDGRIRSLAPIVRAATEG